MDTPVLIEKEDILKVKFKYVEMLSSTEEILMRKDHVNSAMRLGNWFKGKTRIYFQTTEGTRFVETTVWAATDKEVVLKGGVNIPIRSIIEVKF